MKNKIYILAIIIIAIALMAGCTVPEGSIGLTPLQPTQNVQPSDKSAETGYGAVGSFENPEPNLEQMLIYALQDEYLAKAEYDYLINEQNAGSPFTNIIRAEESHISMLIPLFETYGFNVPEDTAQDHLIAVESITQALETGVQAEIDNIAMYEKFLDSNLPEDIRTIFIQLRDASKNHLAAFERKLSRYS